MIKTILLLIIVIKISDNTGEGNEKALNKLLGQFTGILYDSESSTGDIWINTEVFCSQGK